MPQTLCLYEPLRPKAGFSPGIVEKLENPPPCSEVFHRFLHAPKFFGHGYFFWFSPLSTLPTPTTTQFTFFEAPPKHQNSYKKLTAKLIR